MSTHVVIMCAGEATRWKNHLGVTKHMVPVPPHGEPLLHRTLRLVRGHAPKKIFATASKKLPGIETIVCDGGTEFDRFYNGLPAWKGATTVVYLYGDVFYTEDAMARIMDPVPVDFRVYGRNGSSQTTGKEYGEIFAIRLSDFQRARRALDAAKCYGLGRAKAPGWVWYRHFERIPFGMEKLTERFVELADDWTEDFDYPEDYDRWLTRYRARHELAGGMAG